MRIVADKKDYYDGVQGFAHDASITYVRKREAVKNDGNFPHQPIGTSLFHHIEYIVGFCGKIYPLVYLSKPTSQTTSAWSFFSNNRVDKNLEKLVEERHEAAKTQVLGDAFCYSIEDVDRYAEANLNKKNLESYYSKTKKSRRWWERGGERDNFENYFKTIKSVETKYGDFFQKHRTPIFIIDNNNYETESTTGWPRIYKSLIINPILKDIDFAKCVDPYTAFGELEMFFSNLARPEPFVPVPSDKDMVEIKGFDPKWGFRKPPKDKK